MSPAPLAAMTFTPSKEHNQNVMRDPVSGFNMKEIQTEPQQFESIPRQQV